MRNENNTHTANGSTYRTFDFKIKNTSYTVMVVSGNSNYVNVKKNTANPFGVMGKDFANFDEAVKNYKNAQMKVELLKIEMGL